MLKLSQPLPLKEKAQVLVTIQSRSESGNADDRKAWLRLSEERLTKTWDNQADDVFNELLDG